jgi:hypothetical protein
LILFSDQGFALGTTQLEGGIMSLSPKNPTSEEFGSLIRDLGLKEREFELIHPDKSRAIVKILQLGEIAVEPLIEALDTADPEAKAWIIFLLGELMDRRVLIPISKYLNANEEKIRTSNVDALKNLGSREIKRLINE